MTYNESTGASPLASVPRQDIFFDRFTKERQYLKGVTSTTLAWYRHSFRAFGPVLAREHPSAMEFKTYLIQRIAELKTQGRGNSAISIDTHLRWLKTFLRWAHEEGIVHEHIKLSWLKEEKKVLATLGVEQVKKLIAYRPAATGANRYGKVLRSLQRLHVLVCLLLDTGLRIAEALGLTEQDVDLENLLIRVKGKGGKHRLVPMSFELRKALWRFLNCAEPKSPKVTGLPLFRTRNCTALSQRVVLRDLKRLGNRLGIAGVRLSPHTLRHTFAVMYLRRGGNLFYLSRILGHSSIETTQRYLQSLGIEDLKAVHERFSLLAAGR